MALTEIPIELSSTPGIVDNSNATAITIDSSENVGIGTTPIYDLDILDTSETILGIRASDSSGTNVAIRFQDAGTGTGVNGLYVGRTADKNWFYSYEAEPLVFGTSATEAMRIDASGNVGIGTDSPAINKGSGTASALHLYTATASPELRIERGNGTDFSLTASTTGGGANLYSSHGMTFHTNSTTRAVDIDTSGRVGIGTSAPAQALVVKRSSGDTYLDIARDTQAQGQVALQLSGGTSGTNWIMYQDASSNDLKFYGNSSNRMVLDASGNLLVGTTNANPTSSGVNDAGVELSNTGGVRSTVAENAAATFNRKTDDGAIALFRKDGTTVGNIGAKSGDMYVGTGNTTLRFNDADNAIYAGGGNGNGTNAGTDLGSTLYNFGDLYLSGGVYLGGTTAANKLDDYEEGDFTLVLSGATTAGTNSNGSIGGRYTKIGRLVTCNIVVANTTLSGAAGTLTFTGFPFVPAGYGNRSPVGVIRTYQQDLAAPADGYFSPVITIDHGTNSAVIVQTKDNGTWSVLQVENTSGLYFEGTITYPTA